MSYATGHVKRDPDTGAIAVRTVYDENVPQLARRAWQIATPNIGSRGGFTADVEGWDDLYVPEEGS